MAPLQDKLSDEQGKRLAAETTVAGLEETLRWAEAEIVSLSYELCSLADATHMKSDQVPHSGGLEIPKFYDPAKCLDPDLAIANRQSQLDS